MIIFILTFFYQLLSLIISPPTECFTCKDAPAGTIFCDDFEGDDPISSRYFGYDDDDGELIPMKTVGRNGSTGMRVKWQKGEIEAGSLQKFIGRSYLSPNKKIPFPDKNFNEIYWRIDVKNQPGWEGGGGDKLTRATAIVSKNWQQGMIAHIWSGGTDNDHDYLVMDPATGISKDGKLISKRYSDFKNLRWLGNRKGVSDLFNSDNTCKWNCVIAHIKLNTPGKADGIFEFWVNDTFQAGTYDINWHADWNTNPESYMINAVFFENYWNKGSPKDQERYFDNILITTTPIRCNCGGIEN